MLINCVPREECRIAIVTDGKLEELYQEQASVASHVGNIYAGRVVNVEPAIQAAFVDFGLERNGFLHISDLHPRYFPGKDGQDSEQVGNKTRHRDRPPIQSCLRRGQEVIVQILKEGIGTKGPTLTSYLSIPGRYIVMMPFMERLGVSRKVEDDEARRQARTILNDLAPPKDFGFIIRTAGIGRTKTDLKRDLSYLLRLWKIIEQKRSGNVRVGELYAESDLVIRTIRDIFSTGIDRIVVDDEEAARRARDYLDIASPRATSKVFLYTDAIPLFDRFDIERQIDTINQRTIHLPSGGSLVFDQTEALVAIDVNSGKMRSSKDAETTAFKTNEEAADEICRQLRLRDLGGVIIMDLIDMRAARHRRSIEQQFRQNLKNDRARTKPLSISQLGILEMTRQRMRPSLEKSQTIDCVHCEGTGKVKSPDTVVREVIRRLAMVGQYEKVARIEVTISPDVAFHLLNRKRAELVHLEQKNGKPVMVRVNQSGRIDVIELAAFDARGGAVDPAKVRKPGKPAMVPVERPTRVPGAPPTEAEQAAAPDTAPDTTPDTTPDTIPDAAPQSVAEKQDDGAEAKPARRRRRRGGRRRKSSANKTEQTAGDTAGEGTGQTIAASTETAAPTDAAGSVNTDARKPSRSRRRRRSGSGNVADGPRKPADGAKPATQGESTETNRGYRNSVVASKAPAKASTTG